MRLLSIRPFVSAVLIFLFAVLFGAACSGPTSPAASPPAPANTAPEPQPAAPGKNSWPMFAGTNQRNMVNTVEKDLPTTWSIEEGKEQNVKWSAQLGSPHSYGGPVIADGKIYIGTNNGHPRDPKLAGPDKKKPTDLGVMMCFRESDGKFLWQIVHEKLPNEINDWPTTGICSSPVVEDNRLYYVSNRCELVCADTDGKVVWKLDMIEKLKVFPFNMASCSPLIIGDLVYVVTGNGIDMEGTVPAPKAPSFIAVDKKTGEVKWQSALPGDKIMEGQWSNPAAAEVNGVMQVVFPGGDGWLYSFEAKTGELIWKFDCNPKAAQPFKPYSRGDRNHFVATPVIHDNKVYIGVGQNPDANAGIGHFWCIDMTKKPANKEKDLSPVDDNFDPKAAVNKDSGLVWHYGGLLGHKPGKGERDYIFGRTAGTVAIHDGLVYATEMDGLLHCLDAKTGQKYWIGDFKSGTWCSPFYADGKVYVGTSDGDVFIFAAGKELKLLKKIEMTSDVSVPLVAVNGVLYINRGDRLFAITGPKK